MSVVPKYHHDNLRRNFLKSIWQAKKRPILASNLPTLEHYFDSIWKKYVLQNGLKYFKCHKNWPPSQNLPQNDLQPTFFQLTFCQFLMKNLSISQKCDFQSTKAYKKTYFIPPKHKHEPLWQAWVHFYSNRRKKWFLLRIS